MGIAEARADAVDAAIEAAAAAEATAQMAQFGLQLSSGRPAGVMLPKDATDAEILSLVDGIVTIGERIRAARETPARPSILRAPALPGLRRRG